MKLVHNLIQMFRRDNGAYFTYNLGVGFVRASGITIILVVLLFIYSRLAPPPALKLLYKDRFSISEARAVNAPLTFTRFFTQDFKDYIVVFTNEENTYKQYVTEDRFLDYSKREGQTSAFNVYQEAEGNIIFLTPLEKKAAEYEFGRRHMRISAYVASAASGYLLILAAALFGIGARQERLAMKYPRSDVGDDTTYDLGDELDGFGEWDFTNETDTANEKSDAYKDPPDAEYRLEDKGAGRE